MEAQTADVYPENANDIDMLAARVAHAVKSELYRFFEKTGNNPEQERLFVKSWQKIEGEYPDK